ncbi:DNA polymerase zeta processivity subunit-like isoform X2 [Wolffia australiana]
MMKIYTILVGTGAFQRRRYMNIVVHKACHPQLNDYIHSAVFGLLPFIRKGLVDRVAVVFYDREQVPVEKFMFRLALNQSQSSMVEERDLEFSLRAFFIKLSVSEALTKPLPPGCDWEITAYFHALPDVADKEQRRWIPTDTKLWQHPPLITPIKSMGSNPLKLQLYLEHPDPGEPTHLHTL